MKPRDLLPIVERVRRATTNRDVLMICDELRDRLVREMADRAEVVYVVPPTFEELAIAAGIQKAKPMPRTTMDAVVVEAEGGRKPARGKARRAIARKAKRVGK